MLSKSEREYIRLAEKNPLVSELVNSFGLTLPTGENPPDVTGLSELRYSLFWKEGDNTKNTAPRKEITTSELVDIIKSKWLKNLPKIERPYITPYGTFEARNNNSLKEFNKDLIALDYDKVEPEKLNYLRMFWEAQSNTILCLISPSGNGLKVLARAKHNFEPEGLYMGLKHNVSPFIVSGIVPDLMQFVLSQPMFIPYSENPYFNPYAKLKDYSFETPPPVLDPQPIEFKPIESEYANNRINTYFLNRVNWLLEKLENRPTEKGTHQYLYSVLKRIYPYINQQTALTENEITTRLESIIQNKYGNAKEVKALHRSIERARLPEQSLIDLINETARVKV